MKKKITIILLFVFLIFGLNQISAYSINTFEIDQTYGGLNSSSFSVTIEVDSSEGLSQVPLTINSNKQATPISFYADLDSGNTFKAYFYIDFTASSSSTENGWPKIIVNSADIVTVSSIDFPAKTDTLIIDGVKPVIGNFTIEALGTNYNNYYYRGDVNLNLSGFSDPQTYITNYIVYLVSPSNLETFKTNYVLKKTTDTNSSEIKLELNSEVHDGDYYLLVDAVDVSLNTGDETTIKNNKVSLSLDNLSPIVENFNLGTLVDKSTYYVNSGNFNITIRFKDLFSGINPTNPPTSITVKTPEGVPLNFNRDYNSSVNGFFVPISSTYTDGNVYQVSFKVNDFVDNNISYDFNIFIDSNGPTTPTAPTLTRSIDNNITVSSWGTATDTGSGLKEYRVYRSTSSFTSYTNQSLICTVEATEARTCVDTFSKSDDTTYYYGVVAVDKSNNLSAVKTSNIKTGPKLEVNIDVSESYTNNPTPDIVLTLGSDVNVVRFSCNGSSFTSWIEVNNTTFTYSEFNITSGNGCTSASELKEVYVEAKSENSPYPVTRKSDTVKYDATPPTTPTNVKVSPLQNGGLKLTWSGSDDNYSGVKSYRVYYSTASGVTTDNSYYTSTALNYSFTPNNNQTYYIKISAIDNAGNQSSLSSEVSGETKRFGPTFTFNLNPSNLIDGVDYVGLGKVLFKVASDEPLSKTPTVRIKFDSKAQETIIASYLDLITSFEYNFVEDGNVEIEITGTNNAGESSTDTYYLVVDATPPTFEVDYSIFNETIIKFNLKDYSPDLYKVEYQLNDKTGLAIIEDSNEDFYYEFDTNKFDDGDYNISIIGYDYALNTSTVEINFNIDNVNELEVELNNLIEQVNFNRDFINSSIKLYEELLIKIDDSISEKLKTANTKATSAQSLIDANNLSPSIDLYNETNNLLLEIITLLPKQSVVKNKSFTYFYDVNKSVDIPTYTTDANIIKDTNQLYNQNILMVDRNFIVQEIDSVKYFSVSLEFKNTSNKDVTITFIEDIPKEFATKLSDLVFGEDVNVLDADPVVYTTITIPKNSSYTFRYNKKSIATDFDVLTKYDQIVFKKPIILSGKVLEEQMIFKKSSKYNSDSKIFGIIGIVLILIIIILIVIWQILKSKRNKERNLETIANSKGEINRYLGKGSASSTSLANPEEKKSVSEESKITKENAFESNYDYIIDAVKRDKKK